MQNIRVSEKHTLHVFSTAGALVVINRLRGMICPSDPLKLHQAPTPIMCYIFQLLMTQAVKIGSSQMGPEDNFCS